MAFGLPTVKYLELLRIFARFDLGIPATSQNSAVVVFQCVDEGRFRTCFTGLNGHRNTLIDDGIISFPDNVQGNLSKKEYGIRNRPQTNERRLQKIDAPWLSESLRIVKDELKEIKSIMALAIKKLSPFDFWVFNRDYIEFSKLFVKRKSKKPLAITGDTGADTFD